jgi:hypothetical protein
MVWSVRKLVVVVLEHMVAGHMAEVSVCRWALVLEV